MTVEQQPQQQGEPAKQTPAEQSQGTQQPQDPTQQPAQSQQPEPNPQPQQPQQAPEPTFTQEEVNRFLARETAKLERKYQQQLQESQRQAPAQQGQQNGEQQSTQQQPTQGEDVKGKLAEIEQRLEAETQRRTFAEATAGKNLSQAQRETLYKLYQIEKPDDIEQWTDDTAKKLGIQTQTPQMQPPPQTPHVEAPTQTQQQAPQQQAQAQPPPQGGAPNPGPDASMERFEVHPSKLTKADLDRMGPKKVLEYWREYERRKR